ncbi:MAG: DUF429 domain-containing protein [bacterium]|nr:DUF429 domain-containing protein [bacterium]
MGITTKTLAKLAGFGPASIRRVHGVDFSGALDSGKRTWIATAEVRKGALEIKNCFPARDLADSGRSPELCLDALCRFIEKETAAVFGIDFPFGLPRQILGNRSWPSFVRSFSRRYQNPEAFRRACLDAGQGRELRRATDWESQSPFSPYNIRMYRQTYYGIARILAPLVRRRSACILPMQDAIPRKPWVLEVCPATVLKLHGLYNMSYKKKTREDYRARERILRRFEKLGITYADAEKLRSIILANSGGDALDSVIAAFGTFQALQKQVLYASEGYIYA